MIYLPFESSNGLICIDAYHIRKDISAMTCDKHFEMGSYTKGTNQVAYVQELR